MARAGASSNQVVDVLTFKQDLTAGRAVNVHFYNLSHIKYVAGLRRADPLLSVSLSLLFLNSVPFKTLSRVPPSCFLSFLLFALRLELQSTSTFLLPGTGEFLPGGLKVPVEGRAPFLLLFLLGTKSAQRAHGERSRSRMRSAAGAECALRSAAPGFSCKQTPALVIRWPRRGLTFTAPLIFPPFLASPLPRFHSFLSFYICW